MQLYEAYKIVSFSWKNTSSSYIYFLCLSYEIPVAMRGVSSSIKRRSCPPPIPHAKSPGSIPTVHPYLHRHDLRSLPSSVHHDFTLSTAQTPREDYASALLTPRVYGSAASLHRCPCQSRVLLQPSSPHSTAAPPEPRSSPAAAGTRDHPWRHRGRSKPPPHSTAACPHRHNGGSIFCRTSARDCPRRCRGHSQPLPHSTTACPHQPRGVSLPLSVSFCRKSHQDTSAACPRRRRGGSPFRRSHARDFPLRGRGGSSIHRRLELRLGLPLRRRGGSPPTFASHLFLLFVPESALCRYCRCSIKCLLDGTTRRQEVTTRSSAVVEGQWCWIWQCIRPQISVCSHMVCKL